MRSLRGKGSCPVDVKLEISDLELGAGKVLCCIVIVGGLVLGDFHFRQRFLRRIARGIRI